MAVSTADIQKLYIAYFGRPADRDGLQYWKRIAETNPGGLTFVARELGSSPEFETNVIKPLVVNNQPPSTEKIIENYYQNLFGRKPDAQGLAFYKDKVDKGLIPLQDLGYYIANPPPGKDYDTLQNKITKAEKITNEATWGDASNIGINYDKKNKKWSWTPEKTDYPTNLKTDYATDKTVRVSVGWRRECVGPWWRRRCSNVEQFADVPDSNNETNRILNEQNKRLNAENDRLNKINTEKNAAYARVLSAAFRSEGGDYLSNASILKNVSARLQEAGADKASADAFADNVQNDFKDFYRTEKLQKWDINLGAKPPYGDFDPKYYKENNPAAAKQWADAVANDDIDITERYDENTFYLQHYTTQGKPAGIRGNAPEETKEAKAYVERKPTAKDIQDARNLQLGIDLDTQANRVLNIPEVASEWQKAKNRDPYWVNLAKEKFLDIDKPEEFAVLFRLSDRPEDKQVSLNYNINAGYGITQLEDAINQAVGEKATIDVKKFGALAQNVLKDTIAEMKQAKQKEEFLGLLGGFSGFGEIVNINKTLADSILNDTGVGGILSFTSAGKAEESLEKSLQGITGVRNNATYNWQQWFDNQLKTKYNKAVELGYDTGTAKQMVKVEADFARNFIDKYLTPRFNQSKSMDEFVEYLDVRQEEQNPFQTQDMVNAVKQIAELRANKYLSDIQNASDRYFDSDFYFNPTGNIARQDSYLKQATTVNKDWENAKNGDPYWAQQAYRFGIDIKNKKDFARMHFQVKGQGLGYDAADDILNAGKIQTEIYDRILPALKDEALKQGSVFGQFITPEEFADEMLKGLDPSDKSTWDEVLQRYGLTDFKGTVEELKEYIKQTLRTGSAQEIREQIKYLNDKRQRPTQQVLGLTYIERPEDYKDQMATPQTELYKVFQSAGYQGTEDEFYNNFFPDLDRSEQAVLTKAGSNEALKTYGLDFSDPFASLGTVESFFGDEEDTKTSKTTSSDIPSKPSSFFSLDFEDEDDTNYKSKSGEKILGEFTSMFKGL